MFGLIDALSTLLEQVFYLFYGDAFNEIDIHMMAAHRGWIGRPPESQEARAGRKFARQWLKEQHKKKREQRD